MIGSGGPRGAGSNSSNSSNGKNYDNNNNNNNNISGSPSLGLPFLGQARRPEDRP